jgi:hypothetical protein
LTRIWMIAGATFVGVLIVVAIVLSLLQREQSFEDGTPEKAVQDFLKAYTAEDFGRVYDLWAEELRSDCSRDEYIEQSVGSGRRLSDSRVRLTDTEYVGEDGQRAVVLARETRVTGDGPFSTSESSIRQRYTLALEQGEWRFTEVPWPSGGCPRANARSETDRPPGTASSRPPTG